MRTFTWYFYPKQKINKLKIYRGVLCYYSEKWRKNWRGIDSSVQNWQEFDKFRPETSKISKIGTLIGFWPKHIYIMFELKNYKGVMFDGTEYWSKIWRKTNLSFEKWQEGFGNCPPEHLKVSKLGLWWDSFIQRRKCMTLKFIGDLYVITVKNYAKLEEELTCCFKIDKRTLTNFDQSIRKSQKCALQWALFDQSL